MFFDYSKNVKFQHTIQHTIQNTIQHKTIKNVKNVYQIITLSILRFLR